MKHFKLAMSLLPAAGIFFFFPSGAQVPGPDGFVSVEAQEWNKSSSGQPKWKQYPSMTVDSLDIVPAVPDRLNKYGSLEDGPVFDATGFFRVEKSGDRWIMVDPVGKMHIDAAVVGVRQGPGETNRASFAKKFKDDEDWIKRTVDELASFGFNGAGTWSDEEAIRFYNSISEDRKFSYCPMLNLMSGYGRGLRVTRQLPGNIGYPNQCIRVFDPGFEEYCEKTFSSAVEKYKGDPDLLGYFSDNELPVSKKNLEGYLDLPEGDYGRAAAERWLREKGVGRDGITDSLRAEFAGYVADRYYGIVSRVLKKYDPDHMYLGSRLHGGAKYIKEVVQAAGRYCDVISINYYGFWDVREKDIASWEAWTDRPFMITEFYTKAEDSGLTNETGAGWTVHTQNDRGIHYENFILGLLKSRNCVGWSWFKYQDNDPTAKGVDPSNLNSNKGCYDNEYEPYGDLVARMKKINEMRYGILLSDLYCSDGDYDIYLLIGQSNMAGRGKMLPSDTLQTIDGVWLLDGDGIPEPARAPLNKYSTIRKNIGMQQIGPGNSFSESVHRMTGRKILLVVNARGGSSLREWMKWNVATSYFNDAVSRTRQAMKYGTLRAVLWHQGESDSGHPETYMDSLKVFVSDLRDALGADSVPFVAGEIAGWHKNAASFNDMISNISSCIPYSGYVSSEGCTWLKDETDPHFSRDGQIVLGRRYAEKVLELTGDRQFRSTGISLRR